ncbi:MAG: DUF2059 domain-containing protein [Gemmatimonadales bacterium]|nr:DUF2059 domain-containing protein [Gemmatimonadales bacterium]
MRIGIVLIVGCALATSAAAQDTAPRAPARQATIRRFLEITGAAQLSVTAMETMLPAQRAANPQIPAVFWDVFMARARRDVHQLIDSLIPVYAEHFTHAQMEEMVRFYESPLGRHLVRVQPRVTQRSMELGQRWGELLGQQVAESLMQAGVRGPQ